MKKRMSPSQLSLKLYNETHLYNLRNMAWEYDLKWQMLEQECAEVVQVSIYDLEWQMLEQECVTCTTSAYIPDITYGRKALK